MTHSRQAVAWSATVGIALGLAMWSPWPLTASAVEEATTSKAAVQPAPPTGAAQPGGKIVHTFEDSAKMEEFKKVWQQRQGILMRMSVLQAYWNEEKTLLEQLNHTLSSQYALDVAKSYSLDDTRRVLIEQEPPPAAPPAPSQNAPSPKP